MSSAEQDGINVDIEKYNILHFTQRNRCWVFKMYFFGAFQNLATHTKTI